MSTSNLYYSLLFFTLSLLTPSCNNDGSNANSKSSIDNIKNDTNTSVNNEKDPLVPKGIIYEKWTIDGNDGNGEAVMLLYDNRDFLFTGWQDYDGHGKWEYINEKKDHLKFVFDKLSVLWHKTIANSIKDNLIKSWGVTFIDTLNNTIVFKLDTLSGNVYINFFGYNAYRD